MILGDNMEYKIVEKQEFKVVGMDCQTSVQECMGEANKLPALWEKFVGKVNEVKNRSDAKVFYGLCLAGEECSFKYTACVEVSDFEDVPEDMVKETVPSAKFAVFTHKGKLSELGKTYEEIYEKGMPESGLKQKKIWLELYDERYGKDSDDSEIDIYVEVE